MTTATITIQDIIDAIDSEPEMLEALRARLLSRELLELPERFAEFQKSTMEFQSFMLDFRKSTLEFQANAEKRFVELGTNVGRLNGWMTSEVGLKEVPIIVYDMGYEYTRLVERAELIRMARGSDASGIAQSDLDSFIRADAVAEATDEDGRARYIAVEFSFTAQKRDVDRAIRNAEFIARFKDVPASAAVAGIQKSDEIQDAVDAGDVFWHELPIKTIHPE